MGNWLISGALLYASNSGASVIRAGRNSFLVRETTACSETPQGCPIASKFAVSGTIPRQQRNCPRYLLVRATPSVRRQPSGIAGGRHLQLCLQSATVRICTCSTGRPSGLSVSHVRSRSVCRGFTDRDARAETKRPCGPVLRGSPVVCRAVPSLVVLLCVNRDRVIAAANL